LSGTIVAVCSRFLFKSKEAALLAASEFLARDSAGAMCWAFSGEPTLVKRPHTTVAFVDAFVDAFVGAFPWRGYLRV
jgi:hypothetical protein